LWPTFGVIIGENVGMGGRFIDGGGRNSRKVEVPVATLTNQLD
jgi:hypothetical protein